MRTGTVDRIEQQKAQQSAIARKAAGIVDIESAAQARIRFADELRSVLATAVAVCIGGTWVRLCERESMQIAANDSTPFFSLTPTA